MGYLIPGNNHRVSQSGKNTIVLRGYALVPSAHPLRLERLIPAEVYPLTLYSASFSSARTMAEWSSPLSPCAATLLNSSWAVAVLGRAI